MKTNGYALPPQIIAQKQSATFPNQSRLADFLKPLEDQRRPAKGSFIEEPTCIETQEQESAVVHPNQEQYVSLNHLRQMKEPCELMVPEDELPSQNQSTITETSVMRNLFYLDQEEPQRQTYRSNVGDVTHKAMSYTCVGQGPNQRVFVDLIDFACQQKQRSLIFLKVQANQNEPEELPLR